jgi:hypothetical protein
MVYEHFPGCFILEDPSLGFLDFFKAIVVVVVAHSDILRSMVLVLGVGKLLAMTKNTRGLHLIVIGKA